MIEHGPAYNWFPPTGIGDGFDAFVKRWTAWGRDSLIDGDLFEGWIANGSFPRSRQGYSCSLLARDSLRRMLGLGPITRTENA